MLEETAGEGLTDLRRQWETIDGVPFPADHELTRALGAAREDGYAVPRNRGGER